MYKTKILFNKWKLGKVNSQNIWGNLNKELSSKEFKKVNVKKISNSKEKIELIKKLNWKLGYVKKIKKFNKFTDIKKKWING